MFSKMLYLLEKVDNLGKENLRKAISPKRHPFSEKIVI
jgi:hypothetical protein